MLRQHAQVQEHELSGEAKMLNPKLYNALRSVFGSVEIAKEGEQAAVALDNDVMHPTAWHKIGGGEEYRVNCPYCRNASGKPDTDHHLYINYMSYARPELDGKLFSVGRLYANCFRGSCLIEPANRNDLAMRILNGIACADGEASVVQAAGSVDEMSTPYKTSSDPSLEGIRTWMGSYTPCIDSMDPDIREYLEGRGITLDICRQFGIGWGAITTPRTGRLFTGGAPWVIVPIVVGGQLKGIQARCPDKFLSPDGIKYWTHPSMRKSTIVYNIDNAQDIGLAVVCEGVFDVFKVGRPGVCLFGHKPSRSQLTQLSGISEALVWLPDTDPHKDFDTVAEAQKFVDEMNAAGLFNKGAAVVKLSAKDAGEMSRQQIWTEIVCSVPDKLRKFLFDRVLENL